MLALGRNPVLRTHRNTTPFELCVEERSDEIRAEGSKESLARR